MDTSSILPRGWYSKSRQVWECQQTVPGGEDGVQPDNPEEEAATTFTSMSQ